MALRFIGTAKIVVTYIAQTVDGADRARYSARVVTETPGEVQKVWRGEIQSGIGGPRTLRNGKFVAVAVDAPEAYDEMASTAVTFASAIGRDEDGSDAEEREAIACAVEEATQNAYDPETKRLVVRRSREIKENAQ